MKLDIEGSEFDVLPKMLESGAFGCGSSAAGAAQRGRRIGMIAAEWHLVFLSQVDGRQRPCNTLPRCKAARSFMSQFQEEMRNCVGTRFVDQDDDSHMFGSKLAIHCD